MPLSLISLASRELQISCPNHASLQSLSLHWPIFNKIYHHISFQEKLHSVKWYRIDHRGQMQEFYSYKPGNLPQAKRHLQTGIKVDVSLAGFFSTLNSVLSAHLKQGRSLYQLRYREWLACPSQVFQLHRLWWTGRVSKTFLMTTSSGPDTAKIL